MSAAKSFIQARLDLFASALCVGWIALICIPALGYAAPGDILFSDDFESGLVNFTTTNANVSRVEAITANSPSRSLTVQGGNVITTSRAFSTAVPAIELKAWIRRGADTFSEDPDGRDDLFVDYLDLNGAWITIGTFLGSGTKGAVERLDVTLTGDALHPNFQVRFRMPRGSGGPPANGGIGWDYWHIDDVEVTEVAEGVTFALGNCEEFESGLDDWTVLATSGTAQVTTQTANSPSRSLALYQGAVRVTSGAIDLDGASGLELDLWIRRGSDAFSENPDNTNENFVVEYLDSAGTWQVLQTFFGNGTPGQIYTPTYALPSAAHANFQVRVSVTGGSGAGFDFWHVDSVCLSGLVPVAEWRFEEASWDGTSDEVTDESLNGFDGTAIGDAQIESTEPAISGDPGTCSYGDFDGSGDGINIPDDPRLNGSTALSYTAWIYPRSGGGTQHIVGKQVASGAGDRSQMAIRVNGNQLRGRAITDDGTITISTSLPTLNRWSHVALVFESTALTLFVDGVAVDSDSFSATTLVENTRSFGIAQRPDSTSSGFDGLIDEVRVYGSVLDATDILGIAREVHDCPITMVNFVIRHDRSGIHCAPESIQVSVFDLSGSLNATYGDTVFLDTQSGSGSWTLVTGAGILLDAAADDGLATYAFDASDGGTATFALLYTIGPDTINIAVTQGASVDDDSEGTLLFAPSGLTLTANPLSNPPPNPINDLIGTQIAALSFPLYLTAYGTTPTDPACGVIETYDGDKPIRFWVDHANPGSGTIVPTIDLIPIGANFAGAADQIVAFSSGQARVSAKYKDTGLIAINAADVSASPQISGATGNFVSHPADFVITIVENGAGAANLGVSTPTGTHFERAGHPFRVVVEARDAEASLTPNYGQESPSEGLLITSTTLIAPAGGRNGTANDGAIGNGTGFSAIAPGGTFEGTNFSFDEVGAILLQASVADGDFLGTGNIAGTISGTVGRFAPSRFEITQNTPRFQAGCVLGAFSWMDQPFGFATGEAPVLAVRAVNLAGTTAQNYAGAWWLLSNTTLPGRSYSEASSIIDSSGAPSTATDPAIVENGDGTGTLSFSSGTGLIIQRAAPINPFDAEIELSIDILDADATAPVSNPVRFGQASSGLGILFSGGKRFQYGRLQVNNAFGSELVDMQMALRTQYYQGSSFIADTNDSCSIIPNSALSLTPSPGSLSTTPTIGNSPLLAGDADLSLAAANADGFVDIFIDLGPSGANLPWLRYDWPTDGSLDGNLDDNPSGRATFGIWEGRERLIYMREIY